MLRPLRPHLSEVEEEDTLLHKVAEEAMPLLNSLSEVLREAEEGDTLLQLKSKPLLRASAVLLRVAPTLNKVGLEARTPKVDKLIVSSVAFETNKYSCRMALVFGYGQTEVAYFRRTCSCSSPTTTATSRSGSGTCA